MGRPTNPRSLGNAIGSIRVSQHYFTDRGSESSLPCYIIAAKGTNKFRVSDGTYTENLRLVNEDAGSLSAGEMRISGVTDASSVVNITKIRNRSIQHSGTTNVVVESSSGVLGSGIESGDHTTTGGAISIDTLEATV